MLPDRNPGKHPNCRWTNIVWIGLLATCFCPPTLGQGSIAERIPALQTAYAGFQAPENEIEFTPGRLVAVVGEEHVLAGEVLSLYESRLAEMREKATERQIEAARNQFFRQALVEVIKMKMLSQQFYVNMAKNKPMKDILEAKTQIKLSINRAFYESYVPILLKQYKVSNEVELDQALREKNSSLEGQKLTFMDSVLADEFMKGAIPEKVRIDVLDVRDRYEQQADQWQRPARARFQKMSVFFRKFPDKQSAYREIESMFTEVFTGGAAFASVAKRRSQAASAEEGGYYDWTNQGVLKSLPIDQAVFSIPLNRLSQIIEDEDGYHVIMVLEREEARILPFADAQAEVEKQLVEEKKAEMRKKLFEDLRKRTVVWTLWPEDWPNARPLSDYLGIEIPK